MVDVRDLVVIKAPAQCDYVALSYTWGDRHRVKSTRGLPQADPVGNLALGEMPKTILDAVEVTKRLGMSYLWVDRFCIDQTNQKSRTKQISQMDTICSGAELIVVAAAGDDDHYGLPGISCRPHRTQPTVMSGGIRIWCGTPRPEVSVKSSRWVSRAWTLQESLLSHRCLIFTEEQTIFECRSMVRAESIEVDLKLIQTREDRMWVDGVYEKVCCSWKDMDKLPRDENCSRYWRLVETYTSRDLTEDRDSFSAFAGISARFQKLPSPIFNIAGIPFPEPRPLEDCKDVEKALLSGMTWKHEYARRHYPADVEKQRIRRRHEFPSWSWTGWVGDVEAPEAILIEPQTRISFAFESEDPLRISSLRDRMVLERVSRMPAPYLIISGYVPDAQYFKLHRMSTTQEKSFSSEAIW